MKNGYVPEPKGEYQFFGFANCRLCGEELGNTDLTDPNNKYLFPEKWEHYIEKHNRVG